MDEDLKQLLGEMRQENAAAHVETRRYVDQSLTDMRQENAAAHAETRRYVDQSLTEMRQENAATHAETRGYVDQSLTHMRQENAAAHAETRRHFDVTVERLEKKFDTLAETVGYLNEKIDRRSAELEEKIEHTAADTVALFKLPMPISIAACAHSKTGDDLRPVES